MTSSIRAFWAKLDGPVHPDDVAFLNSSASFHTFNLDFPPPAFIGDIDHAPVVILMANGGYNPDKTPSEFADEIDHQDYIDWLAGRRQMFPTLLSPYYTNQKIFHLLHNGLAVIVNAVAYRSRKISEEGLNTGLARNLPSAKIHRRWLESEALPAAARNEKLIVAHRYSLWGLDRERPPIKQNLLFSTNPASPYLSNKITEVIMRWLRDRQPVIASNQPAS